MKLLLIATLIVYTLKIIGLAPFSLQTKISTKTSSKTCCTGPFRFSKIGLAYNFIILILIQVLGVVSMPHVFSLNYPNRSSLTLYIDIIQGIACCLTSDMIIIIWGLRQKNAVCIMNRLVEIDRLLSGLEKEPMSKNRMIVFFMVQITFSTGLWISFVVLEAKEISGATLALIFIDFPALIIYWFVIEYYLAVKIVAIEFNRINNILSKLVKFPNCSYGTPFYNDHISVLSSSSNSPFTALQLLGIIRTKLAEVSQEICDFFSFPILTSVGCFFTIVVYNLYYLISPMILSSGDFSLLSISSGIAWILIGGYPLTLLSFVVTKTADEAKITGRIVHKLLATPMRREIKEQLKQFSLQLLHEHISFTAHGFFTLDCTILHSILGAAATYLVILIQFQLNDNTSNHTLPDPSKKDCFAILTAQSMMTLRRLRKFAVV